MPFNRVEREWVYKSSSGADNTMAFGSTKNLTPASTLLFVNTSFPTLTEHTSEPPAVIIGPFCTHPYEPASLINISAMSYGALSKPDVRTLSRVAKLAGCWLNTGEGSLAPDHLEGDCDLVFQIGTAKYGVRNPEGLFDVGRLHELAASPRIKMF